MCAYHRHNNMVHNLGLSNCFPVSQGAKCVLQNRGLGVCRRLFRTATNIYAIACTIWTVTDLDYTPALDATVHSSETAFVFAMAFVLASSLLEILRVARRWCRAQGVDDKGGTGQKFDFMSVSPVLKVLVCTRACMSKCVCEGIHTQPAVGFC